MEFLISSGLTWKNSDIQKHCNFAVTNSCSFRRGKGEQNQKNPHAEKIKSLQT